MAEDTAEGQLAGGDCLHRRMGAVHFVANCVRSEKGILYNPRMCSRLIGDNPRPIDRA